MGFNCAQEKAKFDREWLRLRKEYTDAGMSEAAIQKIYEYDWYCFCRNRAYERRVTQMPPLEIDSPDDERRSALFRKNEALSASFDESSRSVLFKLTTAIGSIKRVEPVEDWSCIMPGTALRYSCLTGTQ